MTIAQIFLKKLDWWTDRRTNIAASSVAFMRLKTKPRPGHNLFWSCFTPEFTYWGAWNTAQHSTFIPYSSLYFSFILSTFQPTRGNKHVNLFLTRPDTQLPQTHAGGQVPYLRSVEHLRRSSKAKNLKKAKKVVWWTDKRTDQKTDQKTDRQSWV